MKAEEKVNLWIYKENGQEEKIQEIQEEEKVEIGQDTSGEWRNTAVLQPGGLQVSVLWSPLGGRATTKILLSEKSDKSKKL